MLSSFITGKRSTILYILGGTLLVLNILTTVLNVINRRHQLPPLRSFSFVEDDYPSYFPIKLPTVSLTPEDTVHYQLWGNESSAELGAMFPRGGGFLYLGPDRRPFGVAMFHQFHCMMLLQQALQAHKMTNHAHHCLNYIRQAILCKANPTLEPVVPHVSSRAVNSEISRTCKDWTAVHDLIERNHREVIEEGKIWW